MDTTVHAKYNSYIAFAGGPAPKCLGAKRSPSQCICAHSSNTIVNARRSAAARNFHLGETPMIVSAARRISLSILAISLMVSAAVIAHGADGTWTSTASGNWSTSSNWSGGIVANGPAFTANFNTSDPAADLTVTLDANRS